MTIVYNISDTIYLLRTSYKPIPLIPADLMHLCVAFSSSNSIPIGTCTLDNLTDLQINSVGFFGEGITIYDLSLSIPTGKGKLVTPDPFLTRNIRKASTCEESSFEVLSSRTIDVDTFQLLNYLFSDNGYPVIEEKKGKVIRTSIYQGTRYSVLSNLYKALGLGGVSDHYDNCVTWVKNIFPTMETGFFGIPSSISAFDYYDTTLSQANANWGDVSPDWASSILGWAGAVNTQGDCKMDATGSDYQQHKQCVLSRPGCVFIQRSLLPFDECDILEPNEYNCPPDNDWLYGLDGSNHTEMKDICDSVTESITQPGAIKYMQSKNVSPFKCVFNSANEVCDKIPLTEDEVNNIKVNELKKCSYPITKFKLRDEL
tara:strand:+ start:176 stop:1291 length:1116 start_codon:yes stop_codon:yes gene_type:complete